MLRVSNRRGSARAARSFKYIGLDGIIAIGGDGTIRGAGDLANCGVPVISIPASIDNDIGCTEYSIGFDTACNTAIEAIDRLPTQCSPMSAAR